MCIRDRIAVEDEVAVGGEDLHFMIDNRTKGSFRPAVDFQNARIFLVDIKVRRFNYETFVTDAVVVELNFFNWGNRGSRMIFACLLYTSRCV